ncbi:MAG TPA: sugar phosphate nucleotidyltransferase [Chitinophagales bacterium]|nr:sugar phosphate nucleotidyltransferase [Chitinophagales bacterium]HRK27460.1 sugar phosphate nucleotidyltransferase [Chitinophagales bacterium]
MNIIIPMAGRGTRLRPHTLTIPKPLIPIAGKPIVQRLVEDIVEMCGQAVQNIGFIVGDFGKDVENSLLDIADRAGAKGHIFYQDQPLGTAHAILCAHSIMSGNIIVAFADTLFRAQIKIDPAADGIIWTHRVDDPSKFGVVKMNTHNVITEFVEKPTTFVSDMAIIGIYYFKDGHYLRNELQYIIDNDIKDKGEYQLTSALENMKQKGTQFGIASVEEWLDCGNKTATVHTNQRFLEFVQQRGESLTASTAHLHNATIIEPCFIGNNVVIKNAVVGPHVSVGEGTKIEHSVIKNSIIQNHTTIKNKVIANSMIGNHVHITGHAEDMSMGDYSVAD